MGVVTTTYDIARRDIETLREKKFDCVIFDEGAERGRTCSASEQRPMR